MRAGVRGAVDMMTDSCRRKPGFPKEHPQRFHASNYHGRVPMSISSEALISTTVGAAITWLVAWFYYKRAGDE